MFFKEREPVLEEEDRRKYPHALEYIASNNAKIGEMVPLTEQINTECKTLHRKCIDLHRKVDTTEARYNAFNAAVGRLKGLLARESEISLRLETATNALFDAEKALAEHPKYSYMFSKAVDLEDFLK